MRDVQFGRTPPLRRLGTFIEVNVRTDVIDASGRRAVWFFSLDIPRSAAVARRCAARPLLAGCRRQGCLVREDRDDH
jgi:uncharacterized protein YqjF (DUF2071 family)